MGFKPFEKITPCNPGPLQLARDDAVVAQSEAESRRQGETPLQVTALSLRVLRDRGRKSMG